MRLAVFSGESRGAVWATARLADGPGVETPILDEWNEVPFHDKDPGTATAELTTRETKTEFRRGECPVHCPRSRKADCR